MMAANPALPAGATQTRQAIFVPDGGEPVKPAWSSSVLPAVAANLIQQHNLIAELGDLPLTVFHSRFMVRLDADA